MPARSKVQALPPELRAWLDDELLRRGFSDYVQLAADLRAKGADVSKSGLQRHGSQLELRLAQLKASNEQARALVDANPDDEGKMNEAVMRLAQEKIFQLLMQMDIDPEEVDINKLFKNVAEIGKASVIQKKHQADIRDRVAKAARDVEDTARKAGMSDETIDVIRKRILGVTDDMAPKAPT